MSYTYHTLGNLLFLLFGLGELARIVDSHGTSEAVGEFDLGVRAILLMLLNRSINQLRVEKSGVSQS